MVVTPYGGRALLQVGTTRPCNNTLVLLNAVARLAKIRIPTYLNLNFIIDFEGVITFAAINCSFIHNHYV